MSGYYPVGLRLTGRRALVVGGDPTIAIRAGRLHSAGAVVTVVDPEPCVELQEAERAGSVRLARRDFALSMVTGFDVVILGRRDSRLATALWARARTGRFLLCCVDQPECSHFAHPAVLESGPVQVAVSSDGRAPALAKTVRDLLAVLLGEKFARFAEHIAGVRAAIRELPMDVRQREMEESLRGMSLRGEIVLPDWYTRGDETGPVKTEDPR